MRSWKFLGSLIGPTAGSSRYAFPPSLLAFLLLAPQAYGEQEPASATQAAPVVETSAPVPTGILVVIGTGAGPATLSVDGREVGRLPFSGELAAGTHELVASSAHGTSARRQVVVSADGRTEVELKVVENPSRLRVTTGSAGTIIRVDGIPYATGNFDGELPAGKHAVSIERPGYVPSVIYVDLKPDEPKAIDNIVLERATPAPVRASRGKRGIYTIIAADGLLAKPTNSLEFGCPADALAGQCRSTANMGGQLDVHIGYSYGIFGIEGFALGGTNLTIAHQDFPTDVAASQSPNSGIARKERYLIFEPILGGGAAGRVSTQGKTYRLSTSLGLGMAWRSVTVNRRVEGSEDAATAGTLRKDSVTLTPTGGNRAVPLIIWDSDIQLGDTPGTRIFLGIHGQIELGSEPTIDLGRSSLGYVATTGEHLPLGGGSLTVRRSPAFFFGPRLGIITGF